MVNRKVASTALFALALTGGGVAGAVLGVPGISFAQTPDTTTPDTSTPDTTSPDTTAPDNSRPDHDCPEDAATDSSAATAF